MARVIADAGQLLDQPGHPGKRPELGLIPMGGRTLQQRIEESLCLLWGELGFAACPTFASQRAHPASLPSLLPAVGYLSAHTQTARHLRRGQPAVEESGGFPSPPFQVHMITSLCHNRSMADSKTVVTLLYESQ
jgi:hypothetical protein